MAPPDPGEPGRADLLEQKTRAERALAAVEAEKQALLKKVEELDAELGETLVDSAQRAAAQRKALDEMTRRTAELERSLATAKAAQTPDQELSRASSSRRVAELEEEKDALASRLAAVESGRNRAIADSVLHEEREAQLHGELSRARAALAEATARADAEREAKEAAAKRADQLEKDAAVLRTREEKLNREWEATRSEWSERLRQGESLRTERQSLVNLLVSAERAGDRAKAALSELRADLEEQKQLNKRLESEAAAAAARETRAAAAWQTARAELLARIARLEAEAAAAAGAGAAEPAEATASNPPSEASPLDPLLRE
jgi:chromosome segregation ATPase